MHAIASLAPRPAGLGVIALPLVAMLVCGGDVAPATDPAIAAAVTATGFVALDDTPGDRHAIRVARDGGHPDRLAVPLVAPHVRMVGAGGGVAFAWIDRAKLSFAPLAGDGRLGEVSTWGTDVSRLCEGVATNEQRFGIGWLERGGRLWVLHGPTSATRSTSEVASENLVPASEAAPTTIEWCRVASAGPTELALVFGDHARKVYVNRCTAQRCESKSFRVPVGDSTLVNLGCTARACVFVARTPNGGAEIAWIDGRTGKLAWRRPFAVDDHGQSFAITAAGDRAFAIGYVGREGAVVQRVIESGSMVRAWADPYSHDPPEVAWAADHLFVAHRHPSGVSPEVIPLPR